jgi:glycosyltransferase involved in cell wall biosynthesis
MKKIGIECESIEDQTWGVGRIVKKLLEEISRKPELANEFKFFLYFKSRIPDLPFLNNPIFVKKIVGPNSFSLYYYLVLPFKLYFDRLDMTFFPNYMLPILFCGKSLVILTEDVFYEFKSGVLPFRYKLAYRIFTSWAAKHATKIMAISETSKKEVSKLFGIPQEKIVVNPLGVDLPEENIEMQKKDYLLYVGQAFPRRHLKETMLAFEKIAPAFPGLKLIAIGYDKYNPPIIKELKNEINKKLSSERIIYKEYVPEHELAELYTNAKLSIYVSSKEAFGLPPLESLAHKTAPVISDSELNHEIYGNNAFFVKNPESVESIAETIIKGLTDELKNNQIVAAAPDILKKYSWHSHAERFLAIVKNI